MKANSLQAAYTNALLHPMLLAFLADRHISVDIAKAAGVGYHVARSAITYPRITPDGELVGHKYRDVRSRDMWNMPKGISNADVLPLCIRVGEPVTEIWWLEGETDALCAASWLGRRSYAGGGVLVVGIPGSSNAATAQQVIAQHPAVTRGLCFPDSDDAGATMLGSLAGLVGRLDTVVVPPAGADVCSYVQAGGDIGELVAQATPVKPLPKTPRKRPRPLQPLDDHPSVLTLAMQHTDMRRRGGEWFGKCPFHDERTPSFAVNDTKDAWYCHGCNRGGGAREFLQEFASLNSGARWQTTQGSK